MIILTIQCLAPHYTCDSPFPVETGVSISPLNNVLKVDSTAPDNNEIFTFPELDISLV